MKICNEAICEFTGSDHGIQKRQIYDDIRFMKSKQGYAIELNSNREGRKVFYRYKDTNFSINSQPLNQTEANQLKEALLTLSRFKGLPQFNWIEEINTRLQSNFLLSENRNIIEFEQNQFLKGLEFISPLYNAIVHKKVLQITYQGFKQTEPVNYLFHSQLLKQYNSRWFLVGMTNERDDLTNFSLDRIIAIEEVSSKYRETSIDLTEYFENVIGMTRPKNEELQKIQIQVSKELAPYIFSKPLHGSQKIINRDNLIIEIEVFINYELMSLLMSHGEGLKVISPLYLREQLKIKFQNILNKYQ